MYFLSAHSAISRHIDVCGTFFIQNPLAKNKSESQDHTNELKTDLYVHSAKRYRENSATHMAHDDVIVLLC